MNFCSRFTIVASFLCSGSTSCVAQPGFQGPSTVGMHLDGSIQYVYTGLTLNSFSTNGSINGSMESFAKEGDVTVCNYFQYDSNSCDPESALCTQLSCDLTMGVSPSWDVCDVTPGPCLLGDPIRSFIKEYSQSTTPGTGAVAVEMLAGSHLNLAGPSSVCYTTPTGEATLLSSGASLAGCKSHISCANVSGDGNLVFTVKLKSILAGSTTTDFSACGDGSYPFPSVSRRGWSHNTIHVVGPDVNCVISLDVDVQIDAVPASGITPSTAFVASCSGTGCPTISVLRRDFIASEGVCPYPSQNYAVTTFLNDTGDAFDPSDPDNNDQTFAFSIPVTASSVAEDWFVSLNSQSISSGVSPDFGGAGPFMADGDSDDYYCPIAHFGLCDDAVVGSSPDTFVDYRDLQRLFASVGSEPGDCNYISGIDLNGNGVIDGDDALAYICGAMADFNLDGFVDFFDYDGYVDAFGLGSCVSDTNMDGFLDFFDYDLYVNLFENPNSCDAIPIQPCSI